MSRGEKTKLLWKNKKYRQHMSMVHRGKSPSNLDSLIKYMKSDEGRKMARERMMGKTPWNKGKKLGFIPKTAFKKGHLAPKTAFKKGQYTEAMRRGSLLGVKTLSKRKITSIEKKLYQELKERGFLFERQKIINGRFLVDAYIPSLNLVIEADGDYWHSLERVIKKDKAENAYLAKCGFNLLRLSEKEINDDSFKKKLWR